MNELTEWQKLIIEGKICPYCKEKPELIDSIEIYGKSYGMAYWCKSCDAYVGCHNGSNKAKGRLANKSLRYLKKEAHFYFDLIWKSKIMNRAESYKWLSGELDIPSKYTHIGMFGKEACKKVVQLSQLKLIVQ